MHNYPLGGNYPRLNTPDLDHVQYTWQANYKKAASECIYLSTLLQDITHCFLRTELNSSSKALLGQKVPVDGSLFYFSQVGLNRKTKGPLIIFKFCQV